jgi:hypothetical protein
MLFQTLSNDQKIEFFLKCQQLLVDNHPDSDFIFREDNIKDRLYFVKDFTQKYKGFVYSNDNICVLYNKIKLKDHRNPAETVKAHMYKGPVEDFNCIIVDFAVFDQLINIKPFIELQYSPQVEYLIWVKHNEVKLYNTKNLIENLERLAKLPKISFN